MAIIDRGMADISKILEEYLLQIQNHYIEPKINIEVSLKRKLMKKNVKRKEKRQKKVMKKK